MSYSIAKSRCVFSTLTSKYILSFEGRKLHKHMQQEEEGSRFFKNLSLSPYTINHVNQKLIPKGYEIIYVEPNLRKLNASLFTTLLGYSTGAYILYRCFPRTDELNVKDKVLGKDLNEEGKALGKDSNEGVKIFRFELNEKYKFLKYGLPPCLILMCCAFVHFILSRHICLMFRKGDQFKSLQFGLLGTFKRVYIDHTCHDCIFLSKELMYSLKNKKVIISKQNFINEHDFYDVVKFE